MARRFGKLVPLLRQRELGVRRGRPDAGAPREHQRSADPRAGPSLSLAARSPSRRSSRLERPRALRRKHSLFTIALTSPTGEPKSDSCNYAGRIIARQRPRALASVLVLRRRINAILTTPIPKSAQEPGSGTAGGVVTLETKVMVGRSGV